MPNVIAADSYEEGALLKLRRLPFLRAEFSGGADRVTLLFEDRDGSGPDILNRFRLGQEHVPAREFAQCLQWARRAILSTRDSATAGRSGR